jgi:thiol:disulfide interchange protein DsbD
MTVTLPVNGSGELKVSWQGCADAGLCYAPQSQAVIINGKNPQNTIVNNTAITTSEPEKTLSITKEEISIPIPTLIPTVSYEIVDEENPSKSITQTSSLSPSTSATTNQIVDTKTPTDDPFDLRNNPFLALFTLFALGIGLAFTPCVLPMLPIVAGIVARQHASNARQGFFLAFAYGVGVASSYAVLGALVSLFGSQANLSLWLQHPVVLSAFSALFVVLALASFDVFHLQLPSSWQHQLDALSKKGKAGSFVGTWLMGFFSALVVSPCVSAPLAGVLLSASTLGNPLMGAIALFALGLGLSTPLMILGASEGRFMPKAGLWLNRVKQLFGVMLLGVAVILLSRVLHGSSILVLWAILSVGTGFWLNMWGGKWRLVWRSASYIFLIWGATLLVGAATGGTNPLQPLDFIRTPSALTTTPSVATTPTQTTPTEHFQNIKTVSELDAAVAAAYANNQKVLVDFYADWCVSCKIMDKEIFAQADIQQQLNGWVLLRADVTDNTDADRELMQRFQVFGPPAILFFEQGLELSQARIVGETTKEGFSQHLQKNFQ